jgi:polyhydroxybutyrate depolymerase
VIDPDVDSPPASVSVYSIRALSEAWRWPSHLIANALFDDPQRLGWCSEGQSSPEIWSHGMKLFALILALSAAASAQTITTFTAAWNGLSRTYSVYVPVNPQPSPPLVMVLHPTINGTESATLTSAIPFCQNGMGWSGDLQSANGYILLCPVATWKPGVNGAAGYRFWEADTSAAYFPTPPDDAGFLRSLILQMELPKSLGGYGVDPNRVFVTGMSSGGMMTHAIAKHSSDLIAAIGPISGTIWIGTPETTLPTNPVSVIELHGDQDKTIPYCAGSHFNGWGEKDVANPSVDVDINFWLAADGLPPNSTPMCNGSAVSDVYKVSIRGANGVEVQFMREIGDAHAYLGWTTGTIWEFFNNHGR